MSLEHQLAALRAVWARGDTWTMDGHGASMWPALRPGDQLIFSPPRGEPRPGEIWLFCDRQAGRLVAHRVVGPAPGGWRLRGDAMPEPDPPVSPGDLLAPLLRIRRRGRVRPAPPPPRWLNVVQRHPRVLRMVRVLAGLTARKDHG